MAERCLVGNSFAVKPALGKGSYDLATFAPVCHLASTPLVLVVKGDAPYRTLADLLAAARAKPGDLSLASGGPASALHVAFEVVRRAAGVTMTYVPYGGTAPAINALMGWHSSCRMPTFGLTFRNSSEVPFDWPATIDILASPESATGGRCLVARRAPRPPRPRVTPAAISWSDLRT
jgi:Tripartite tricarboxylate transporter family receptor